LGAGFFAAGFFGRGVRVGESVDVQVAVEVAVSVAVAVKTQVAVGVGVGAANHDVTSVPYFPVMKARKSRMRTKNTQNFFIASPAFLLVIILHTGLPVRPRLPFPFLEGPLEA